MLCAAAHATPQRADRLVYRGENYRVYPSPLGEWLRDRERPEAMQTDVRSSGCWQGYVCAWEIRDNALFLTAITVPDMPKWREVLLSAIFPEHQAAVPATWFTGTLDSPQVLLKYIHLGAGGHYLYEKTFDFREGLLVGTAIRPGMWFVRWVLIWVVAALPLIVGSVFLVRIRRQRSTQAGRGE
jgi:hypothetical protein